MTSIITHEIEERYPYPDNGERPVTQTRLGACLASRKAYRAGATRNPTDREIDMAALAVCRSCPVVDECRAFADDNNRISGYPLQGIWGGKQYGRTSRPRKERE